MKSLRFISILILTAAVGVACAPKKNGPKDKAPTEATGEEALNAKGATYGYAKDAPNTKALEAAIKDLSIAIGKEGDTYLISAKAVLNEDAEGLPGEFKGAKEISFAAAPSNGASAGDAKAIIPPAEEGGDPTPSEGLSVKVTCENVCTKIAVVVISKVGEKGKEVVGTAGFYFDAPVKDGKHHPKLLKRTPLEAKK